jgi:hypothetical protein
MDVARGEKFLTTRFEPTVASVGLTLWAQGRLFAADIVGHLFGYAQLTNTRALALVGDPDASAYELLFSFSSPAEKKEFLSLVRSNEDMGTTTSVSLRRPPLKKLGMLVHSQRSYRRMPSPMPC